jgi:hypothetical protein
MAAWRCVYDPVTGNAISFGTDVDAPILTGQAAVRIETPPNDACMWDPNTRTMVLRPQKPKRKPIVKE